MSDYGDEGEVCYPALHDKTPDEAIVIEFPWAARLDGETISSRSFELPDGLTNETDAASGTKTTIRVSGGDDGNSYRVIGKITTNQARDLEWVQRVIVREG